MQSSKERGKQSGSPKPLSFNSISSYFTSFAAFFSGSKKTSTASASAVDGLLVERDVNLGEELYASTLLPPQSSADLPRTSTLPERIDEQTCSSPCTKSVKVVETALIKRRRRPSLKSVSGEARDDSGGTGKHSYFHNATAESTDKFRPSSLIQHDREKWRPHESVSPSLSNNSTQDATLGMRGEVAGELTSLGFSFSSQVSKRQRVNSSILNSPERNTAQFSAEHHQQQRHQQLEAQSQAQVEYDEALNRAVAQDENHRQQSTEIHPQQLKQSQQHVHVCRQPQQQQTPQRTPQQPQPAKCFSPESPLNASSLRHDRGVDHGHLNRTLFSPRVLPEYHEHNQHQREQQKCWMQHRQHQQKQMQKVQQQPPELTEQQKFLQMQVMKRRRAAPNSPESLRLDTFTPLPPQMPLFPEERQVIPHEVTPPRSHSAASRSNAAYAHSHTRASSPRCSPPPSPEHWVFKSHAESTAVSPGNRGHSNNPGGRRLSTSLPINKPRRSSSSSPIKRSPYAAYIGTTI